MNLFSTHPVLGATAFETVAFLLGGLVVGGGLMLLVIMLWNKARIQAAKEKSDSIIKQAGSEADVIRQKAEVEAKKIVVDGQDKIRKEGDALRAEMKEAEKRLAKREDNLEAKLDTLVTKERNLEQQQTALVQQGAEIEKQKAEAADLLARRREDLLRVSGMSSEKARELVLEAIEVELEHEVAEMVEKSVATAKEEAVRRSREITLTAIQRYAGEHTAESTVATVDIPSDDVKGRVIGREGRNIRAFEKATGVDVIVDDTPGVVLVSGFNPIRKEVARRSLERLIQDGRIHPARIEEIVVQVQSEVDEEVFNIGKQASIECNVSGLHRKQLELLGGLKFRTSYGQNVLRHSIEVALLCQGIAEELGLDGRLARRCGLLHDIGKAIDLEMEGSHPKIGADFCRKFKERPEVLNAIEGHHGDIPSTSPYTPIVMAADAISAARPGSRRESLERYIQRLQQLEELAMVHEGVKEAFAIQAGREVRVIVDAKKVDDAMAAKIARDVAQKVEETLTYPGEIRITVLREVRAVASAR
jgi:ribonuclease Y